MKYNLDRFIEAQKRDFQIALKEIENGQKESHWMWYIFPQLKELGYSSTAKYYGIDSLEEAVLYMQNEYLRDNLIRISSALLRLTTNDAYEIFGDPDYKKLQSCMTLFYKATNNTIFKEVLDKYFTGNEDTKTLEILNN